MARTSEREQAPALEFDAHPLRAIGYAAEHALTAEVVVSDAAGRIGAVWFERGAVARIQLHKPALTLGDAVVQRFGVDLIAVEMLAGVGGEARLAAELLGADLVTAAQIEEATSACALADVEALLRGGDATHFAVYRAHGAAPDALREPLPPILLFVRAARMMACRKRVDDYVTRLAQSQLRLGATIDLSPARLDDDENRVAAAMRRGTFTIQGLVDDGAPRGAVHGLVFAVSMVGGIERVSISPRARSRTTPNRALAQDVAPHSGVTAMAAFVAADDAPTSAPQAKATSGYPQGTPSTAPRPFRRGTPHSERAGRSGRPSASDLPTQSDAPGASLAPVSGPPRDAMMAMRSFQEAERAIGLKDFTRAGRAIVRALRDESDNPSYRALNAYVDGEAGSVERAEVSLAELDAIIIKAPQNAVAHYYRARLLKRLRRHGDARAAFALAAKLDPTNQHAVEESTGDSPTRRRRHSKDPDRDG
jgi:hypothetical protein